MDTSCRCSMNACCATCLQTEARRQKVHTLIAVTAVAVVIVALAFSGCDRRLKRVDVVAYTSEVPTRNLYLAGEAVTWTRMVGLIRRRPESLKRELLLKLADAWSSVIGEPVTAVVMFLIDIPGYQVLENGVLLPEADQDAQATGRP